MIFHVVEEERIPIKAACEHFGVTVSKFKNEQKKRKRVEDDAEQFKKTGRKPSISKQSDFKKKKRRREKREEMRDKKRREREAKASRELEKARKAATKGEKQRIMELMESGALSGKKGNTPNLLVGEPFFCTNPVCAQQRQCVVGRRWMVRLFGMLCTVRSLVLPEEGLQVEVDATHECVHYPNGL